MVDEIDNKILLVAFYNGVSSDLFIHKLYDQEPQTMAKLIHSAQSFINAKDAIIAKEKKKGEYWKMAIYTIQSKVLIQRKPKYGRKGIATARKQGCFQDYKHSILHP